MLDVPAAQSRFRKERVHRLAQLGANQLGDASRKHNLESGVANPPPHHLLGVMKKDRTRRNQFRKV
jgi:hypothetical protein